MSDRNEFEFRVFGLRRTGQHAIIVWLAHHFPDQSVFFINDVAPGGDPFTSHCNTRFTTSNLGAFVHRAERDIVNQRNDRKKCLMYNYEDRRLPKCQTSTIIPQKEELVGTSTNEFNILILRDPFNLAASRLQMTRRTTHPWFTRTLDLWVPYAKEFLGITSYLRNKVCINFNRWFMDKTYRTQVSTLLGLQFTDAGLNRVVKNGGGSSWDRTRFDTNAQRMDVLGRWTTYAHDRDFRAIFINNPRVNELSQRIFGNISGTDALFKRASSKPKRIYGSLRLSIPTSGVITHAADNKS